MLQTHRPGDSLTASALPTLGGSAFQSVVSWEVVSTRSHSFLLGTVTAEESSLLPSFPLGRVSCPLSQAALSLSSCQATATQTPLPGCCFIS